MKIVVKIGSSSIINDSTLEKNTEWIEKLGEDIAKLRTIHDIIIVSSGAVAMGRRVMQDKSVLTLPEKQAMSSIGQAKLMSFFTSLWDRHGLNIGQIMLSNSDLTTPHKFENLMRTISILHNMGVVPVCNENDSTSVREIVIGNNDYLAAEIACLWGADRVVFFSDVDGVFNGNPNTGAELIPLVHDVDPVYKFCHIDSNSTLGTGGMVTKLDAAKKCLAHNIQCHVGKSGYNRPVTSIIENLINHTIFTPL